MVKNNWRWFPFSCRLEDILRVVFNLEFAQKLDVFLAKGLPGMMALLVLNIANYRIDLGARVGKRTKSLLPGKSAGDPSLLINESRGVGFDVP